MRIPDPILECVAFVGYDAPRNRRIQLGTAFLFGRRSGYSDEFSINVVTAKHVINNIWDYGTSENVYLRFNNERGGTSVVTSRASDWSTDSKNPNLDIAVLPSNKWSNAGIDYRFVSEEIVVTEAIRSAYDIGVGDQIFLTGLFVSHYGSHRNLPIVRQGSIASMPAEQIKVNMRGEEVGIDAYLVEAMSIGGLSGSPVFVRAGGLKLGSQGNVAVGGEEHFLLGLIHGHWELPSARQDTVHYDGNIGDALNTGIGIVIPATKISSLID
jgi:hypothetical protein